MNNIFKQIPEFNSLLKEYRQEKRGLFKKKYRLKQLTKKYRFLENITSKEIDDIELENEILKLFKIIGYKTHKPINKRDVDCIIYLNNCVLGIEVKNSNYPTENELFQALKYCNRNRTDNFEMFPIVVWNNAKTNQAFDQFRIKDAVINNFGIITTKELVKGFLKFKQEKITKDEFEFIITRTGLIKYSNKSINESGKGR